MLAFLDVAPKAYLSIEGFKPVVEPGTFKGLEEFWEVGGAFCEEEILHCSSSMSIYHVASIVILFLLLEIDNSLGYSSDSLSISPFILSSVLVVYVIVLSASSIPVVVL